MRFSRGRKPSLLPGIPGADACERRGGTSAHENLSGIPGVEPASESLSARTTHALKRAVDSYRWPKDPAQVAARVQEIVAKAGFERPAGGGTLLSEPIVVLHGKHEGDFELFDQSGSRLGSAAAAPSSGYEVRYELRDPQDRCLLVVELARSRFLFFRRWAYTVHGPDGSQLMTVENVSRWSDIASIAVGPDKLGMLRPDENASLFRRPSFGVEDNAGHEVARVSVARTRSRGQLVDLIVHVEDGAPEQPHRAALAASLILDHEQVSFDSPG